MRGEGSLEPLRLLEEVRPAWYLACNAGRFVSHAEILGLHPEESAAEKSEWEHGGE